MILTARLYRTCSLTRDDTASSGRHTDTPTAATISSRRVMKSGLNGPLRLLMTMWVVLKIRVPV